MQSARHIWRGQQNTKVILFIGVKSSGIVALGLPKLVPTAFYAFWIKGFFQILLGSLIRGLFGIHSNILTCETNLFVIWAITNFTSIVF